MKHVPMKMPVKTMAATPDCWVQTRAPAIDPEIVKVPVSPESAEPTKRFTIDVSASLHERVEAQCAMRGVKMADGTGRCWNASSRRKVENS